MIRWFYAVNWPRVWMVAVSLICLGLAAGFILLTERANRHSDRLGGLVEVQEVFIKNVDHQDHLNRWMLEQLGVPLVPDSLESHVEWFVLGGLRYPMPSMVAKSEGDR